MLFNVFYILIWIFCLFEIVTYEQRVGIQFYPSQFENQ